MVWQEYYSRFYDWAESTQLSRISSLTDFGDIREICEIAENFMNEKGASRLVRKALSQNVYFDAESVIALCEYIDTETLKALIPLVKEPFTQTQITHLEECSMLFPDEIKSLLKTSISFANATWEDYYNAFYNLSDSDKVRGAKEIKDFSEKEEVIEIIFQLAELGKAEEFILNALNCGIKLSVDEIEGLIDLDNKKLNKYLIFHNLDILKQHMMIDEFDYLKNYLYKDDFSLLKKKIGYKDPVYIKPKKMGFLVKVGAVLFGAKVLNYIFGDKKDDE